MPAHRMLVAAAAVLDPSLAVTGSESGPTEAVGGTGVRFH